MRRTSSLLQVSYAVGIYDHKYPYRHGQIIFDVLRRRAYQLTKLPILVSKGLFRELRSYTLSDAVLSIPGHFCGTIDNRTRKSFFCILHTRVRSTDHWPAL